MKLIKNEKGYIVSVTAIAISVILGLAVLFFRNSISVDVASSANNYSATQARWTAVAGIEHAFIELYNGIDGVPGTFNFYNGQFTVDTLTIDPSIPRMQITSTGTHAGSMRIFTFNADKAAADSLLDEAFIDDEGFDYSPTGTGPGANRFWGFTCSGYLPNDEDLLPQYVLTGADSCFFFGTKVQNNSNIIFTPLERQGTGDYMFTLSLAAGIDVAQESKRDNFQTGDFLEFSINDILVERWQGESAGGGNPLCPVMGNSTQCLTNNFEDYTFNLTQIIGVVDTFRINIEGKTNNKLDYIGIEGISLLGLGGWSAIGSTYKEL